MMNAKGVMISLGLLLLCLLSLQGQEEQERVAYTPEYEFEEGVYANYEQFRNNEPIPKNRIASTHDYKSKDFFELVLRESNLYYYDNLGNKHALPVSEIWGYCRNGFIYIGTEEGFFRITLLGSASHFVASVTSYSGDYYSPYQNNAYYDQYRSSPTAYSTTEMRQYLLEFETGRVVEYDVEGVELILMSNTSLHDEFMALSKKKKKQMKFVYIRKFNEQNKMYFPKK